jgi:hypothetical protein
MAIFYIRFRDMMNDQPDVDRAEFYTMDDAVEEALRQAAKLIKLRRQQGMDYVYDGVFEICDPSGAVLRRLSVAEGLPRIAQGNPMRTFTTGKMDRQDGGGGVYCNYRAGGPASPPKKEPR